MLDISGVAGNYKRLDQSFSTYKSTRHCVLLQAHDEAKRSSVPFCFANLYKHLLLGDLLISLIC